MGEKIADLGFLTVKGANLAVEINESAAGSGRHDIHLQGVGIRIDLTPAELVIAGATILAASRKLRQMKKISKKTITDGPFN